jgi:uncharacterized protein (TIGR02588 family)
MNAARKTQARTPLLEWIAAGVGLLLVLFVFGVIGREAVTGGNDEAPAIEVMVERITPSGPGYVVEFVARNRSGGTAAAVEFEGELKGDGTSIETSTAVIDYVPGNGRAEGGLYFSRDPRQYKLQIRPLGYLTP